MNGIRRNTDPTKGPPDGVAADIKCAVTQFDWMPDKIGLNEYGKRRTVKGQANMPCTVYCSFSDGTVGVSIRDIDMQIDIRVDELMAVMRAGAEANKETAASQDDIPPQDRRYPDAMLEEKWRELQTVGWDEADSPTGQITARAFWIFPQGVDRLDMLEWFGDRHSKGLKYLSGIV